MLSKLCLGMLLASACVIGPVRCANAQDIADDASTNAPILEPGAGSDQNPAPAPAEESSGAWKQPQPVVQVGTDFVLKSNEEAEAVVIIGGSATIHGRVRQSVVVIGGNLNLDGSVDDAAVAVLGNISMEPGASVRHDAVAVMGELAMAPGSKIGHNAVSVGGRLAVAEGANIGGARVNPTGPFPGFHFDHLKHFLKYCVLEMRPLAFQVRWVWVVSGVFFLLYLLVAVVFPRPVQVCVEGLTRRPATTFLLGLLGTMLVPVVLLLLAVTGVGVLVIPFVIAAALFGVVVGKTALLEWMGIHLLRPFGVEPPKPLVAFLLGWVLITLLYVVPILGLLTFAITSVWSLGGALTGAFNSFRHELPPKTIPPSPPPVSGPPVGAAPPFAASFVSGSSTPPMAALAPGAEPASSELGAATSAAAPGNPLLPPPLSRPATPPVYPLALSLPKAGFWERMAAGFLDLVIIGVVCFFIHFPPLVALAYFVAMWMWKGTTVGGVVLKLQVVRTDGHKITFPVALVRALGAALSFVVLFLGFLWIAWDKEKEAWHDKIAGTAVVRVPQSIALICL